jgi:two-component system LytT family response regulator
MLGEVEWVRCVGEAASGPEAIQAIATLQPELVFLDIEMPGLSGIDVLCSLQRPPYVVFTTAYAEHAVAAFELGAIDYLLKPFGAERLLASLERVRAALGEPRAVLLDRIGEALSRRTMPSPPVRAHRAQHRADRGLNDRLVRGGGRLCRRACRRSAASVAPVMDQLEERLDPQRFARIHRTHIVNLDHVVAFRRQLTASSSPNFATARAWQVSRAKAQELRHLARLTSTLRWLYLVIPAKAGLRRQDAGANIRVSEWPEGHATGVACNPAPSLLVVFKSRASAHLKVSGLLLFAWPKRSNQEKGHPGGAPSGHPALQVHERTAGFAECTSVYMRRTGAHRARHPAGFSSVRSPRLRGPVLAASCRRSQESHLPWLVACVEVVQDARIRGSTAPFAVPSIAAFAGSARRRGDDRRACEAVDGCTV